jgi:putative transposase
VRKSASRRRFCRSGRGGPRASTRCCVLYLRRVSAGDFQEGLAALLGKDAPNLSPAVISRLTAEWQADYDAWQKRDLSERQYVYVWADGVYLQARMEDNAECMLVLIGATPEDKKELVGFQTGVRESAQSWRELLIDIKQRGLEIAPDLAVGGGANRRREIITGEFRSA